MHEDEIAKIVLDHSFNVHRHLGPGLLESVYETVLSYELKNAGLEVRTQVSIPFSWKELQFDNGFRADIIVDNKVILEIKSVEKISPIHPKQLLTYLKLTGLRLGLVLNFNEELLKNGIKRVANNLT